MRIHRYRFWIAIVFFLIGKSSAASPWYLERGGKWPEYIRGPAHDVAISDNKAYVAAGGAGLMILDLSDPMNPTRLGGYDTPGDALAVAVSGSVVYVADGAGGLRVIDATDPANPVSTGGYPTQDRSVDVALNGSVACVAAGEDEFIIFDATDVLHPFRTGSASAVDAGAVAIAGNYLYVGDGKRFRIFDISNRLGPRIALGSLELAGTVNEIAIEGSFAYVALGSWSLTRVDISDPTKPTADSFAGVGIAVDVAVRDQIVYTASDASGLIITDLRDPLAPQRVGGNSSIGLSAGVALFGNYAVMANSSWGVGILDLTNLSEPEQVATFDTDGSPEHVTIAGNLTIVCDGFPGVQIIDSSNPALPKRLRRLETTGRSRAAAVQNDHVLVSSSAGVEIFDIAHPTNALRVGIYSAPGADFRSIAVRGKWVYAGGSRLEVIDAQDPTRPVSESSLGARCDEIVLSEDRLFILNQTELLIYDVSTPESPVRLSRLASTLASERFNGLAVADDFVYVAGTEGLLVVDASSPAMPIRSGNVPGTFHDVAVYGQRAFVTFGSRVKMFDLKDPRSPSEMAAYDDANRFYTDVAASGDAVFVLTRSPSLNKVYGGLEIFTVRGVEPSLRVEFNGTTSKLVLIGVSGGRYAIDHTSEIGKSWTEVFGATLTETNKTIVPTTSGTVRSGFFRARLLP